MRWRVPLVFEMRGKYKVFCVKILINFLLRESRCLFEIFCTSTTVKTTKNTVKRRFLKKHLRLRAQNAVANEGEMLPLFCKNIDNLLNYYKVSNYFK